MTSLAIIYHSQSGTSAGYARAACAGARRESGVAVELLRACDADVSALERLDGLMLVAPENAGYLAGGMKEFLDRVFYPMIARQLVLPYALVISAGNDGRNAARQAEKILSGIPCKLVAEPLVLRGETRPDHTRECADLGQALAAGLIMGIY